MTTFRLRRQGEGALSSHRKPQVSSVASSYSTFNGKSGAVACEFNHSSWLLVFLARQQIAKKEEAPDSFFVSQS
jgi:hypothetical protein